MSSAHAQHALQPGNSVGQYVLLRKVGSGGMGEVWSARNERLETVVALKFLRSTLDATPQRVERLRREVVAMARVNSPYVVRAITAEGFDSVPYIVMEFIEGRDIGAMLKERGKLTVADACEIGRQTALGLHAIDQAGLLHRDIKPSNLRLDTNGTVKILDLGLAQFRDNNATRLTLTGQFVGSFEFIPPERLDKQEEGIRSEVFSLGCTLYALLTGAPPQSGSKRSLSKLIYDRVNRDVPPLDQDPRIPLELSDLIAAMLHRDHNKRPGDLLQIADSLSQFTGNSDLNRITASIAETCTYDAWDTAGDNDDEPPESLSSSGSRSSMIRRTGSFIASQKGTASLFLLPLLLLLLAFYPHSSGVATAGALEIEQENGAEEIVPAYPDFTADAPGTYGLADKRYLHKEIARFSRSGESKPCTRAKQSFEVQADTAIVALGEIRQRNFRFSATLTGTTESRCGLFVGMHQDGAMMRFQAISPRVAMSQQFRPICVVDRLRSYAAIKKQTSRGTRVARAEAPFDPAIPVTVEVTVRNRKIASVRLIQPGRVQSVGKEFFARKLEPQFVSGAFGFLVQGRPGKIQVTNPRLEILD